MKKLVYILLSFTAIFVGCTNVEDVTAIEENNTVTIHAYHNSTSRVTFNGQISKWENNDVLKVIVDGLNAIYPFNYTSENTFVCNSLTLPADQNNLYAFSGVNPQNINISTKTASVELGAATQVQDNQKPTAHIAGYDILYGVANNVGKDNISIVMNHTIAVLKINITNALQDTQTIKSVKVTTPDVTLSGRYNITPAANDKISAVSGNSSNSVTLTFDEVALSNTGAPFTAWIAVAPFKLANGDEMAIDITTSDGKVYRCVKTFDGEGKEFAAGSVMSTSIVLGGNATLVPANQAESITILVDKTTLPSIFPNDVDDNVTSGKYTIGGCDFEIASPTPFHKGTLGIEFASVMVNNAYKSVTDDDPAKITLPIIQGYILSSVTMASTEANSKRQYKFSIVDSNDNTVAGGGVAVLDDKDKIYTLSNTSDSEVYYVKIGNKNKSMKTPAVLTNLLLTYTKVTI